MSSESDLVFIMVENETDLKSISMEFQNERVISVDLEADSMYHFKEKVCLIQISTKKKTVLIDPLSIPDLSCLKPVFSDVSIKKIFHGADYDIRSLYRDFGIEINNLFDTELACRFLGMKKTGLDAVLEEFFNVSVDKHFQKKDWSKRPLTADMLEYAARDTAYLSHLAEVLEEKLNRSNRMEWVSEECELLSRVRPETDNGDPLFLRFKGAGALSPRNLAVLENLLRFRLSIAEKKDKPLFKIISNRALLKMASSPPGDMEELKTDDLLSDKQIEMYGKEILNSIRDAKKIPFNLLPRYPKKRPPETKSHFPRKLTALKKWRDREALKLKIDPSQLVTKNQLYNLAQADPVTESDLDAVEGLKGWQKSYYGGIILMTLKKVK